jgi:hypothetical protein
MVHKDFGWHFQPSGERKNGEEKGGPRRRGFSLFMRFLNSNRVTYEKLELDVTRTKQTIGPVSNRLFCRSSRKILSHFRTPIPARLQRIALADHCPLTTDHCHFLIGTQNTSREFATCRKQIACHFLIGTENALFPKSHRLAVVTCHSSLVTRDWGSVSGV